MHWKLKAAIQNAVSRLPSVASYSVYYWIQRRFGQLSSIDPRSRLSAGIETWNRIIKHGRSPVGKRFFEVGTGHAPIVPIAYWLLGAKSIVTVDLNPYMKDELILQSLQSIANQEDEIRGLFGQLLDEARFGRLLAFARGRHVSTRALLDLCHIDYRAPSDAAATGLANESIDFHTSCTVLEHIPPDDLLRILMEGNRITRPSGLFVHRVDYSDHFSHSDGSISPINFLQYGEGEWMRYAGNRYMYMNRLRHDDMLDLFDSAGHRIVEQDVDTDDDILAVLSAPGFQLDRRFATKSAEILTITGAWIVTERIVD